MMEGLDMREDYFDCCCDDDEDEEELLKSTAKISMMHSVYDSLNQAEIKYKKPDNYCRNAYADQNAMNQAKSNIFNGNTTVKDPYTGKEMYCNQKEAIHATGGINQSAETDHNVPLKTIHEQVENNPLNKSWLTNEDVKNTANSQENFTVTSREINNPKRDTSNQEFVNQNAELFSADGKKKAVENQEKAQAFINRQFQRKELENIVETGHEAGMSGAVNAGTIVLTMSGINNIVAVINSEKSVDEAIADTIESSGKAAVTGYISGNLMTVIGHSLSNSSNKLIQTLVKMNVPAGVLVAVQNTFGTLKRYINGEMNTQECIIELGEKGINCVTAGYSMIVGQTLIPIPVIGGAVGALVGSVIGSSYYNKLVEALKTKQLDHQKRQYIISECKMAAKRTRDFRLEFERYTESYFKEYRESFEEALSEIHLAFEIGDVDGVIEGANQITRKLGGKIAYETLEEFEEYLNLNSSTKLH